MIKVIPAEPEALARQEQLLELIRQTSIPGAVTYHYERPLGYEAFAKTQGTNFELWEAKEGGKTLGFTQITYDQITWNGKPAQISYSGDTRVIPSARGRKVSDHLIRYACKQTVPVFGAVMGGNKVVLQKKLKDWKKVGVNFEEVTELKAMLYRPIVSDQKSKSLLCRTANDSDLKAMYFLWKQYAQNRNLTRHYPNIDAFAKSYQQVSGISLQQTIVVYDGITLVGMLSLWDQSKDRKLMVDNQNIWIKIASRFIRLPKVGKELKILYSYQHAFLETHPSCQKAIELMIAKARTLSFKAKVHFFSLGMDMNDPQFKVASKSALVTNTAKIILDTRGNLPFKFQNHPLHLEVGMG